MKPTVQKVAVYITNRDRLLVFRHTEYPEAGIQVPAGTMEPGEGPLEAALREAREESGLEQLTVVSFLGMRDVDCTPYGKDQIHHRHFFHFEAPGNLPDTWLHDESDPSDHSAASYELEFFWAALPDQVPAMAGEQDALLPALLRSMEHASYIRRCYTLARRALKKGNAPYGALLVHQGKVILEAENTSKTERDLTRHADLNLVRKALRKLTPEVLAESTMYSSTEACIMCAGAIELSGIPAVVYGVSTRTLVGAPADNFILDSRAILAQSGSRVTVQGPVLEAEGLELFAAQV